MSSSRAVQNSTLISADSRDHQLWLLAQKILSFDDPARKSSQIRKAWERLNKAANPAGAVVEHTESDINALISCAFAARDALDFLPLAFDAWALKRDTGTSVPLAAGCETFLVDLGLSANARSWCAEIASYSIPWHRFAEAGAWSEDERASLVAGIVGKLQECPSPKIEDAFEVIEDALAETVTTSDTTVFPRAILLLEGATESILLPHFGQLLGTRFAEQRLLLISGGGANQVCKRFLHLRDTSSLPLFAILDADAEEQSTIISESLRPDDRVFVLKGGEIEDTLPTGVFARLLNVYMRANHSSGANISAGDLKAAGSRITVSAHKVLKQRGAIDFDKVAFARLAVQHLNQPNDVPPELREILEHIANARIGEKP